MRRQPSYIRGLSYLSVSLLLLQLLDLERITASQVELRKGKVSQVNCLSISLKEAILQTKTSF